MTTHRSSWAESETQRGHNPSGLMHACRWTSQRAVQTFSCGELWNLEVQQETEDERIVMGGNVPFSINFLSWLGCKMKLPGWEVPGNWRGRQIGGNVTCADQQSCPKALQGEEAKPASHFEEKCHNNVLDPHLCLEHKEASPAIYICPWAIDTRLRGRKKGVESSQNAGNNKPIKQGQLRNHIRTNATKKMHRVLVIQDSMLPSALRLPFAAQIISPARFSVCQGCMLEMSRWGYHVWWNGWLLSVLIQVGSQEAVTVELQNIKRDFRSLGKTLKGSGVQVVFSSVHTSAGWKLERRRRMDQANYWLCGWCHDQGLGFYDLGQAFWETEDVGIG